MKLNSDIKDTELTIAIEGSIDTVTSPLLESELKARLDKITVLILDFTGVTFISSAGLRVIIWARKQLDGQGKVLLKNVHEDVKEVFELTGLDSILEFV